MDELDVLVIAPHPDDEVLGCGGSIINHLAAGRRTGVAYLTSGEHASPTISADEFGPLREDEARAATGVLGVPAGDVEFLRIGDGSISPADLAQMGAVMELLRRRRPRLLYLPHPREPYDHRAAFELCWRAAGMAGSSNYPQHGGRPHWVETILGYEVWTPISHPEYGEDITPVLEQRTAALAQYGSQSAAAKGEGQADYIGRAARFLPGYRGAMSVGGYREAFQVLRLGRVIA
ncbi:PIG-L deacetylase family protein [Streptosporangium canum]|uniref:PIG-L deacetylase family protein n=1 Tax=Streptosporangium canum TaxID=324952 RepID=UPI003686D71B